MITIHIYHTFIFIIALMKSISKRIIQFCQSFIHSTFGTQFNTGLLHSYSKKTWVWGVSSNSRNGFCLESFKMIWFRIRVHKDTDFYYQCQVMADFVCVPGDCMMNYQIFIGFYDMTCDCYHPQKPDHSCGRWIEFISM